MHTYVQAYIHPRDNTVYSCMCVHMCIIHMYIQSLCEEKLYLIFHVLKLNFEPFFSQLIPYLSFKQPWVKALFILP